MRRTKYAILEPDDIAKVKLKTTKVIDIVGFIDKAEISPMLYDSPYFAGPDGEVGVKTYALLSEVLKESGKIGLGKVVLRDREDFVALAPEEGGLVLYKLRFPKSSGTSMKSLRLASRPNSIPNELKLARTLVDQMVTSISEIDMKDRYNEALRRSLKPRSPARK